ncbi:hypothetical protein RGQ29_011665 [Quercus rubra]|uniref:Uncharacterized protein n=1 Tax=Quercus rubra TaxID=3512 RepID=A0AAN7FYX6_QUERU|nr:hypothetical protein RGQ29_011665 [Quercus rubra]
MQSMLILHSCAPFPQPPTILCPNFSLQSNRFAPFLLTVKLSNPSYARTKTFLCKANGSRRQKLNTHNLQREIEEEDDEDGDEDEDGDGDADGDGDGDGGIDGDEDEDEFSAWGRFRRREEEEDFDRDPEIAEILGHSVDNPEKFRSKMKERLKKKRNKILQAKAGSAKPMKVTLNKFKYADSYIWLEFYNNPLEKDISLICDTIRSWHIIGRLGGCNSMNMQLSQAPMDNRPSYDAIQGANTTPTAFYNIGDLEIQDNLARIWVDIGTSEPLLLDVLINALTQISSDMVGIKQLTFGGSEFENWKENLKSEDAGYSVHKI